MCPTEKILRANLLQIHIPQQIWVGDGGKEGARLDDVVLAIGDSATKVYGPAASDGAGAAGSGVDDVSESFARKLNAKLGKAVYFRLALLPISFYRRIRLH